MSYCTKQDLIDRFGERELVQLTDRTNTPASMVDDTVVARALGDAGSLVDGYVGKSYSLPLPTVPEALTKVTADIARFYLHGKGLDKDSPIRIAYSDAVSWLRDIARGMINLFDNAGETPPASGGGFVQTVGPVKVFNRDSLRVY